MSSIKPPVMALDVGTVRIGVAISDPLHITAQALTVIQAGSLAENLAAVEQIAKDRGAGKIIVGLPKTMKGGRSKTTQIAEDFARALEKHLPEITVELWDERLSTVQARSTLIESGMRRKKRKENIDKVAAALILQNYLDNRSRL